MIYLYNSILAALFVPALIVLAIRYRKNLRAQYLTCLPERLGFWNISHITSDTTRPLLWVHCASLGEVRAVEPLVRTLTAYRILITVLTYTGRDYALEHGVGDAVYFLPVDFSWVMRSMLSRIKPIGVVIVETELWPGMLWAAHTLGIPVMVVNGRLSNRSFPAYYGMRAFWKPFLRTLRAVLARSEDDRERFVKLGVPLERTVSTGNIKYDRTFSADGFERADAGFSEGNTIIVAGSTRPGEEAALIDAWLPLLATHTSLRLVIAPRHLDRLSSIETILRERNVPYGRYSLQQSSACLLLDTFGDLQKLYSIADISFVGGSLVPRGGQNPIEPAAYGTPVIFGPFMDNFLTEATLLVREGGARQLFGVSELMPTLRELIGNPSLRASMGSKARKAVESQRGALARTKEHIEHECIATAG